jgi:hypothetical protein
MSDAPKEPVRFSCVELVAEKTGELSGRVGKIESDLSSQTAALDAAVVALNAGIEAVGLLRSNVLKSDLVAWQHNVGARLANIELALSKITSSK